jgi:hypothetical protein
MQEALRELVRQLDGAQIYGGCEECDAYQTMDEDPEHPGIIHIRIHHDDFCPFLARITERKSR